MALKSLGAIIGVVILALVIAAIAPRPEQEHFEGDGHDHSTTAQKPEPVKKPEIQDIRVGKGRVVEPGDTVSVHYDVYLKNGKKIESSRAKGKPLAFLFGGGMAMPGWETGLEGVREGGRRQLVVPPELAYADKGSEDGKIPPNATLRFEIEVVRVHKLADEPLLDPLLQGTEHDKGASGE
ncbi:MAG: FKBP-type peptidyl-prolyl cis-trans isomerase [Armatimonadetes bacterium]|nr:FKBP-type peptidyl-prolyl cis-trans isomerase [Armatimonadota bacterium]